MLAERVKEWTKDWREESYKAGVEQRREEDRQWAISTTSRLLEKRFGSLPAWAKQKLQQASSSELECWSESPLDAETLDIIFTENK